MSPEENSTTLRTSLSAESHLALALILWVLTYTGLSLLSAALPDRTLGVIPVGETSLFTMPLAAAVALVVTTLWLLQAGVVCQWRRPALIIGAVICVVVLNLIHTIWPPHPGAGLWVTVRFGVSNVALLGAALCVGKLVGEWVEHPSWVVPICLVALAVDCWSVFFGPTREIAEAVRTDPIGSEAAQRLMIWYPNLTPPDVEGLAVHPSFGVADFIVAALLFQIAAQFGLNLLTSLGALIVALLAASVAASLSARGLPALPFVVFAFLAVQWRALPWRRREIVATVIFITVLLLALVWLVNPLLLRLWPSEVA